MFEIIMKLFGKKKHSKSKAGSENDTAKLREAKEHISSELWHLKNSVKDDNAMDKSRQFFSLVKDAYYQSLSLKYNATFQEIQTEINKRKHVPPKIQDDMNMFLEELSYMDYDWEEYLKTLKKQCEKNTTGDSHESMKLPPKTHHALHKRLNKIVRERKLTAGGALLVYSIERFEGYLKHLF